MSGNSVFQPAADRVLTSIRESGALDDCIAHFGSIAGVNNNLIAWLRYGYDEEGASKATVLGITQHSYSLAVSMGFPPTKFIPIDIFIMDHNGVPLDWMRSALLEREAASESRLMDYANQVIEKSGNHE